jgi:hypothetical protein
MEIEIAYNPEYKNIVVSSRPKEKLGLINGPEQVLLRDLLELNKFPFEGISFDGIDTSWLSENAHHFAAFTFDTLCFQRCKLDLENIIWRCRHLIIGKSNNLVLKDSNFLDLKEITFLSIREFKGRFLGPFKGIEKAVLWKGNEKVNEIIRQLPDIRELSMFQGSVEELDLLENLALEVVDLHLCTKLKSIKFNPIHIIPTLVLESCNKLPDMSAHVGRFARFPPIKSK